jgi:hypothetical protein
VYSGCLSNFCKPLTQSPSAGTRKAPPLQRNSVIRQTKIHTVFDWKLHRSLTKLTIFFVFVFCVGPAVTHRMYCRLPRLIVLIPLWFPPSSPEALHIRRHERPLLARGGTMGKKCPIKFSLQLRLPR